MITVKELLTMIATEIYTIKRVRETSFGRCPGHSVESAVTSIAENLSRRLLNLLSHCQPSNNHKTESAVILLSRRQVSPLAVLEKLALEVEYFFTHRAEEKWSR
jgi:hypothetical protein